MYNVTAHYDVIYYIHHRRKRHFEVIVDRHKVFNAAIICIDKIRFRNLFNT